MSDVRDVLIIPAASEAFVVAAELERVVVLQQAQRGTVEAAQVGVAVSLSDVALVFLERRVERPIQPVRDGRDLAGLGVDHRKAQADAVGHGPGAAHVQFRHARRGIEAAPERFVDAGHHRAVGNLVQCGDPAQHNRHSSNSAGFCAPSAALNRSCEGRPLERARNGSNHFFSGSRTIQEW
jgi:hypothetical protein